MNTKKIRLSLMTGAVLVILIDMFFLWILNMNEAEAVQQTLKLCILILAAVVIAAIILFFLKGPVFNIYGQVETGNIMAMLISVLVIMQLAFSFEIFSQKDQEMRSEMYGDMRYIIAQLENCTDSEQLQQILEEAAAEFDSIGVVDIAGPDDVILRSSDTGRVSMSEGTAEYIFPFYNDCHIVFHMNHNYRGRQIFQIWLNLATTLVIAIFFSVEMVWGMIGMIKNKNESDSRRPAALAYVRQIAFLFYFASRLSSAFITIMAKNLGQSLFGSGSNMAAGVPQSAETLFTCVAIFATTALLEKKGWKFPFGVGLAFVAFGTLLSGLSPTLPVFILARGIVGLGYGFCWMTLRNLALFGQDEKEKTWGFSMLNAGLYAGMNCGSALGSILAERFGYRNVFFLATALTVLCSIFIIRMENAVLPKTGRDKREKTTVSLDLSEKLRVFLFAVLMITPSCIVASYLSYFLPLYYESIGRSVSDVGRAQLLYGLIIVYVGPVLSAKIIEKTGNLLWANIAYNTIFSVGLIIAGGLGGIVPSILAVIFLGVADSFGFGVQNNYFLAFPAVSSLGESKSLSYLSFLKKITEMLGPTAYAVMISLGFERGLLAMGILFVAAVLLFGASQILGKKRGYVS